MAKDLDARAVTSVCVVLLATLFGRSSSPVAAQSSATSSVAGTWCAALSDLRTDVYRACMSGHASRACVQQVPVFDRIALAVSSSEVRASYGPYETVAPFGALADVEDSEELLLQRGYEMDGDTLVEHTRVNEGDLRATRRFTRDGESLVLVVGVTWDWGDVVVTHRYHRCE